MKRLKWEKRLQFARSRCMHSKGSTHSWARWMVSETSRRRFDRSVSISSTETNCGVCSISLRVDGLDVFPHRSTSTIAFAGQTTELNSGLLLTSVLLRRWRCTAELPAGHWSQLAIIVEGKLDLE